MKEQCTNNLKKVTVFSLSISILLWSIRTSSLVKDVMLKEVRNESMIQILPTIITMKNLSLSIKLGFN